MFNGIDCGRYKAGADFATGAYCTPIKIIFTEPNYLKTLTNCRLCTFEYFDKKIYQTPFYNYEQTYLSV